MPRGAELLFSYGDLSDAELLQMYGFVEREVHPCATASVTVQELVAGCLGSGAMSEREEDRAERALEAIERRLAPAGLFELALAGELPPRPLLLAAQALLAREPDLDRQIENLLLWDPSGAPRMPGSAGGDGCARVFWKKRGGGMHAQCAWYVDVGGGWEGLQADCSAGLPSFQPSLPSPPLAAQTPSRRRPSLRRPRRST